MLCAHLSVFPPTRDLAQNSIGGVIPTETGLLRALTSLYVRAHEASFCMHADVTKEDVQISSLTCGGALLPSSVLFDFANIRSASFNTLTGAIPTEISRMEALTGMCAQ